jgi:hypothetical protein
MSQDEAMRERRVKVADLSAQDLKIADVSSQGSHGVVVHFCRGADPGVKSGLEAWAEELEAMAVEARHQRALLSHY